MHAQANAPRAFLLGAVFALSTGCDRASEDASIEVPLDVATRLSGCAEVHRDNGCVLSKQRELRWWLSAPEGTAVSVLADGKAIDTQTVPSAGGERHHFEVPDGVRTLELQVALGEQQEIERWNVRKPPSCPVIQQMRDARKEGDVDRVESLAAVVRSKTDDPCRATVLGELARTYLAEGRQDQAIDGLRTAMLAQRQAGCISCEARDAFALSYALTFEARRFGDARAVLEELAPRLDTAADAWAQVGHYQGITAFEAGDIRSAVSSLQESDDRAAQLGLEAHRRAVALSMALSLQRMGRAEEAVERLQTLRSSLPDEAPACERAVLHNNLAWASLAVAEGATGPIRTETLKEVIDGFEIASRAYGEGCNRASQVRNVWVNLAYANQRAGEREAAHDSLARAREAGADKDARTRPWLSIIAGNLSLDEGRARAALTKFRAGLREAEDSLQDAAAWQARLGEARAHEALGDLDAAIEAYRLSEAMLDTQVPWIPLIDGLDTFLASREVGSRALVDLLLRANRAEEAMLAARGARARALWSLRWVQQLEGLSPERRKAWEAAIAAYHRERAALEAEVAGDWQLSEASLGKIRTARRAKQQTLRAKLERSLALLDESAGDPVTPPPLSVAEDEMVWMAHPAGTGWVCFALDADGLQVARLDSLPPLDDASSLAEAVLAPFASKVQQARRIRVLGYGPFRNVDVHALPWGGKPLAASKSVVFAADLREPENEVGRISSSLLVADPRQDLPSARLEADAVTRALPAPVRERLQRLDGRLATHAAVVDAVSRADFFHYAGHGEFAGRGGWNSALPLADDGRLTVGDILALPRAPRWVVLSGCETGRTSNRSPHSQIGLAQAFALAGSNVVVAATRPVDDELASRMSAALYASWSEGALPQDALAGAQRVLLASSPEQDWAAFRAYLP